MTVARQVPVEVSGITVDPIIDLANATNQLASTNSSMLTKDTKKWEKIMAVLIQTSRETTCLFVKRRLVVAAEIHGVLL